LRVATIDIGTNTVLLLIAEVTTAGLVAIVDRAEITRLGQGVDRTRVLAPEAVERTLACLRDYAEEISKRGVDRVDVVGTSAMRDAGAKSGKSSGLIERAASVLGVLPRVISGEEEASLAFSGGLLGLELAGEVLAFDVGGGSTEIIRGRMTGGHAEVDDRKSLDVGSVRLFERHVRADPPSAMEMSIVRAFVLDQLLSVPPPPPGRPLVGMAGTVTTLAAVARGIDPYDPARIHGMHFSAGEIAETARRLADLPLAERKAVRGLAPKRADVIPVGGAIVEAVVAWAGAPEVLVSDRGVRWGLAEKLASLPA
jgi:exopolyphosphatase/guanosine-5'-triphosphate,3'-diphosphate pyrophosphatase